MIEALYSWDLSSAHSFLVETLSDSNSVISPISAQKLITFAR